MLVEYRVRHEPQARDYRVTASRQVSVLADGTERVEITPQTEWEERAFPPEERVLFFRGGREVPASAIDARLRTVTASRLTAAKPRAAKTSAALLSAAAAGAFALYDLRTAPAPTPRPIPFAGMYPEAVRDGRGKGAMLGVRDGRDVLKLARALGIAIEHMAPDVLRARAGQPAAGIYARRDRKILVDASLPASEQLVVIAHELGHAVMGHRGSTTSGWNDPKEVAAEAFGHAFLGIDRRA